MNEAKKVFYDDVKEKKQIAQNAFKKKGGLNTAKAPFNNYTKPQADKKNGDISMFNLNRPMNWSVFRIMPIDLQKKYMLTLLENGANTKMMAVMFNRNCDTIRAARKRLDIPPDKHGYRGNPERFEAWKKGDSEEPEESPLPVAEVEADTAFPRHISGRITVECRANELVTCINTLTDLLGGDRMHFSISYCELEAVNET